ncbi:MAG: hypothetical protein U0457_06210 [Candidatus Sericytochromatia bacterium]
MTTPIGPNLSGGITPEQPKVSAKRIEEMQKDGIASKKEQAELFNVGLQINDKKELQELKQGISGDFPELAKALDEGFEAKNNSKNISNIAEGISKNSFEKDLRGEALKTENMARRAAGATGEALEGASRFTGGMIGSLLKKGAHALNDLSLSDEKEKAIDSEAKNLAKNVGVKAANFSNLKIKEKVLNNFEKKEAAMANCVIDSLHEIGFKDTKKTGVINVNTDLLSKMTGKEWSAVDVASSNKEGLKKLLADKSGKALVTDGGHAYVLKSIDDKTGNLNVYDATVKKDKILNKDNTHVSIFMQGKPPATLVATDSIKLGKAKDDKDIQVGGGVNKLKDMNSVDKTNGKNNESWELRKTFILFGDPTKKSEVNKIKEAIGKNDLSALEKNLKANGINLDQRELKAMNAILGTKIADGNAKVTTMIEKFQKLSQGLGTSELTQSQANYLKAVEYSNVDLNNYFSGSEDAAERAKNMLVVFNNMVRDGEGC